MLVRHSETVCNVLLYEVYQEMCLFVRAGSGCRSVSLRGRFNCVCITVQEKSVASCYVYCVSSRKIQMHCLCTRIESAWRDSSTQSCPRHGMEVSGKLHVLPAVPTGKVPRWSLCAGVNGSRSRLGGL
jgi:hypothetical protein